MQPVDHPLGGQQRRLDPAHMGGDVAGQGDIGAVLWSISAVAADWQNAATLTALCTIPDDTMPTTAQQNRAATMLARHILDPLRWFGLLEYRGPEVSVDVRWRKTALFDRFLSFDVRLADGRTRGH